MAVLMQAKISRAAGTKMSSETRSSQAGGGGVPQGAPRS